MKRSLKLMGLAIFLSLILTGGIVLAASDTSKTLTTPGTPAGTLQPQGKCCIAGKYQGSQTRIASKGCTAETVKFTMEINQDKGCGSRIWGRIIGAGGDTNDFKGTVTAGTKGCCNISGSFGRPATGTEPAERTDFKGVLCKKDGKWVGKGTYKNTRGLIICNGTWEISQM